MRSFWEPVHKKNKRHNAACQLDKKYHLNLSRAYGSKIILILFLALQYSIAAFKCFPFFFHVSKMRIFFKALQIRLLMIFHLVDIC